MTPFYSNLTILPRISSVILQSLSTDSNQTTKLCSCVIPQSLWASKNMLDVCNLEDEELFGSCIRVASFKFTVELIREIFRNSKMCSASQTKIISRFWHRKCSPSRLRQVAGKAAVVKHSFCVSWPSLRLWKDFYVIYKDFVTTSLPSDVFIICARVNGGGKKKFPRR